VPSQIKRLSRKQQEANELMDLVKNDIS